VSSFAEPSTLVNRNMHANRPHLSVHNLREPPADQNAVNTGRWQEHRADESRTHREQHGDKEVGLGKDCRMGKKDTGCEIFDGRQQC
jgi:hypothetical protein